MQAEKDSCDAAQAAKREKDTDRLADIEKSILAVQQNTACTANFPLVLLTPDIAELSKGKGNGKEKGKGKTGKPKSVSTNKRKKSVSLPVAKATIDVDTKVDETQREPEPPKLRKKTKRATQADIEGVKKLNRMQSTKGAGAREPFITEKVAEVKEQGGKRKRKDG